MQGNPFVYIALLGWIPLVLGLFAFLPARTAVIWGFLLAWLFLPMAHIPLHPFTDYNKMSASSVGVLLGALIFDSGTLFEFRPSIWDLPMLVWCIVPFFSSWTNGLGAYDGVTAVVYQTTLWGLPYLIGRLYFTDLKGIGELARGIVIGGLLYVPLCLFEIRFSPQLHRIVYGFYQYEFGQTRRDDTHFRPMVFMQTGLAVGMWMAAASLVAFWLMWCDNRRRIFGMPMWLVCGSLVITTMLCRSLGATVLMFAGMGLLALTRWIRSPIWMIFLALAPGIYMVARGTNMWTGQALVQTIERGDINRGSSLEVRFESERLLVDQAMHRPIFGWAGWDRFRAHDEEGNDMGVPDALWIIALGHHGLVGLISLTAALCMPILLLLRRIPVRYWTHAGAAPAAALAVLLGLHMCDNLMNAMINPIFMLCAGGITGLRFSLRNQTAPMAIRSPQAVQAAMAMQQAHALQQARLAQQALAAQQARLLAGNTGNPGNTSRSRSSLQGLET